MSFDHASSKMNFNVFDTSGDISFSLGEGVQKLTINNTNVGIDELIVSGDLTSGYLGDPYLFFADVSAATVHIVGSLNSGAATFAGNVTTPQINLNSAGGGIIDNQTGNIFIQTPSGTGWIFRNGPSGYDEKMRIDSSGNVTLNSATALDFQVADFAQIKFRESGAITIDSDNDQSSRNFAIKDGDGTNLLTVFDTGNTTFAGKITTSTSNAADNLFSLVNNTAGYATVMQMVANTDGGAIYNSITSNTSGGSQHWKIWGGAAVNTMAISTGGTERMRITSGGNIEQGTVGTTASAYYYFNATTTGDTGIIFRDNASTNSGFLTYNHDQDAMKFATGGSERMRIDSSGRVGIGTGSDALVRKFTVDSGTQNIGIKVKSTDAGSTISFEDNTTSGDNVQIGAVGDDMYIIAGGGERMRITSGGKVGIGGIVPSQQLELGGIASPALKFTSTGTNGGVIIFNVAGADKGFFGSGYHLGTGSSNDTAMRGEGDLVFLSNGNNQRMRITSGGVIQNESTTSTASGAIRFSNNNFYWGMMIEDDALSTGFILFSAQNGDSVGSITRSGLSTSFNTSSDYILRIKRKT